MTTRNPIVNYLKRHEWEWVPQQNIVRDVDCTSKDFEDLTEVITYRSMVEIRDNEYRYVGHRASYIRRIVDAVREAYPAALTGPEIGKRADIDSSAWRYVNRYSDLLPIEIIQEHEKYHGNIRMYRYIPDDRRSMLPATQYISLRDRRAMKQKEEVLKLLRKHPGTWFSAKEIAARLGLEDGSNVNSALYYLMQAEPRIRMERGKGGIRMRNYYTYQNERKPTAAIPRPMGTIVVPL